MLPSTVQLIQAGALLALYDYAHGKPDDAFLSVNGCARMGYVAGLYYEWLIYLHNYTKEDETIIYGQGSLSWNGTDPSFITFFLLTS